MEGSFSPIVRKIAAEVVSKPRRSFVAPNKICLQDWWLLMPANGEGIAVSGRPFENLKCDDAQKKFKSASSKKRYALREFNSTKVVKRHDATVLETSDGVMISLCGFINKPRTLQNGFSSEACRDFIYGCPFNWDDYTAQSAGKELKSKENFIGSFVPDDLNSFNGAQLHDALLSLTDTDGEHFMERIISNLTLNPEAENGFDVRPSRESPSSPLCIVGVSCDNSVSKARKKRERNTSMDVSLKQESRNSPRLNQNRL